MNEGQKFFKKNLVYDWPLYLLLPLIFSFTLSFLFSIAHQPSLYEKINIFVASTSLKSDGFCQNIQNRFKDKGLKEVTTAQCNPSDKVFSEKLQVVGYGGSDLFLLPRSALDAIAPSDIMLPFSSTFSSAYVIEKTPIYYVRDNVNFGIEIRPKGQASWLENYVGFLDEDYFLCLNSTSKNIGTSGLYDNPEYDLALQSFMYLQGDGQ